MLISAFCFLSKMSLRCQSTGLLCSSTPQCAVCAAGCMYSLFVCVCVCVCVYMQACLAPRQTGVMASGGNASSGPTMGRAPGFLNNLPSSSWSNQPGQITLNLLLHLLDLLPASPTAPPAAPAPAPAHPPPCVCVLLLRCMSDITPHHLHLLPPTFLSLLMFPVHVFLEDQFDVDGEILLLSIRFRSLLTRSQHHGLGLGSFYILLLSL